MGLRYRKSIKLGKGVKLNLNKNSFGLSVGTKGARMSVNSNGRRTTTIGVPGTGLSYTNTSGMSKSKQNTTKQQKVEKKPMKTGIVPLILTVAFGWMGLHWFISGRFGMGFLYLFTCGLFCIGWFVDIIRQIIALCQQEKATL